MAAIIILPESKINDSHLSKRLARALFKFLLISSPILYCGNAAAGKDEICADTATNIEKYLPAWDSFIKQFGGKNPSVERMLADSSAGTFKKRFLTQCKRDFGTHKSVYECLYDTPGEVGAQMCIHPNENKSGWTYGP